MVIKLSSLLIVCSFFLLSCTTAPSSESKWIKLIDGGYGLNNWHRVGEANWISEDLLVSASRGSGGFLVSKEHFGDFELYAEFWAESNTNSGIFFRCTTGDMPTDKSCYEANIFDLRPDPTFGTGAIVNFIPAPPNIPQVGGKWSNYRIIAKGDDISVSLDGAPAIKLKDNKFKIGPIALQYGGPTSGVASGGAIKWRKVLLKRIKN